MSEKVNVEARTKRIISDLLALPISEISLEKRFIEDFHIDSLDSVELATALADEFGIEVSEEDGLGLLTVASVVQFVQGAPQRDTSAQLEEPTDDATYFLLGCDAPLGRRRVLITHRDPERWPWLTGEKLEEPPTEPLLATFEMNGDDGDLLEM